MKGFMVMARKKNPGGRPATHPPITITHPLVAAEWHSSLNGEVLAEDVTLGVEEPFWWHGAVCGHDWHASPYNRTHGKNGGTGCSVCNGKRIEPLINSLQAKYPLIAAEWNYELNDTTPDLIAPGESSKLRWWDCDDPEHPSYRATAANRTTLNRGCPYCAGRYPVPGKTDLPTMRPLLMPEWDYENNTRAPETCMVGSDYMAAWKCVLAGHTWKTQVKVRAIMGSGCPKCYRSTSNGENELQKYVASVYSGKISTKNRKLLGDTKEVDLYMPELKIAIEYNGLYYHSVGFGTNKHETYHADKCENAAARGLRLFHVWEDDWRQSKVFVKRLLRAGFAKSRGSRLQLTARYIEDAVGSAFMAEHGLFGRVPVDTWVGLFKRDVLMGVVALSNVVNNELTVTNFVFDHDNLGAVFTATVKAIKELFGVATLPLMLEQGSALLMLVNVGDVTNTAVAEPVLLPAGKVRLLHDAAEQMKFHVWDAGQIQFTL